MRNHSAEYAWNARKGLLHGDLTPGECQDVRAAQRASDDECCTDFAFVALQVKGEVEAGISYLLRKRETDQYRHFLPRIIYETASGGRQAPTFDL